MSHRTLVVAALLVLVSGHALCQEEIWSWEGEGGSFFGVAVAPAGDVNADGHDDVIIGDYHAAGVSGMAYVYSGQTGELLHSWIGGSGYSGLGRQVAGLGDIDDDGFDDVVVSAFWESVEDVPFVGRVYAYSGSTGDVIWNLPGESESDYFGRQLAPLGDLNKDGINDVVISSDFHSGPGGVESGKVFAVDGATGTVLWTRDGETAGDRFGANVGGIDDIDGDDKADVLVGAFLHDDPDDPGGENHGKVYVLSGGTGKELFSRVGEASGDRFGTFVDGVANPSGDLPTFLVGAPGHDDDSMIDTGRAYLFSSNGTLVWTVDGGDSGYFLGAAVSDAGDTNGDGVRDLLLGAPRAAAGLPGMAILYSGANRRPLWTWTGEATGDSFGLALSSAGDVDRDGLSDLLVGAYRLNSDGKAYVFSGNDLLLESPNDVVTDDDLLFLETRGGIPGASVKLFVVNANGLPFFINVASWILDGNGEWIFASSVPPEAVGLDLTFLSISGGPELGLHDSNHELVLFR